MPYQIDKAEVILSLAEINYPSLKFREYVKLCYIWSYMEEINIDI